MEMPMITTANFEEKVMQSSKPVLMIFSAPWCGYCKRLKPALMQLAGEIMEQVAIGGVNIDDVGKSAAFLLSDMASGITGEILHVDAGFNAVVSGL